MPRVRADYPEKAWITQGSPVIIDGQRRWIEYRELDGDDSDFEALGADFAVSWFEQYRGQ